MCVIGSPRVCEFDLRYAVHATSSQGKQTTNVARHLVSVELRPSLGIHSPLCELVLLLHMRNDPRQGPPCQVDH